MPPETRGRGRGRDRGAARSRGRGTSRGASDSNADSANAGVSSADQDIKPAGPRVFTDLATEAETKPTTSSSTRGVVAKPSRGSAPSIARFRPKNIRRDEASRDQLARQEQDKDNAKAKEEARRQARSRGRSRRSRGDVMGRGGMNRRSVASGPFSSFLEGTSGRGGWGGGGGGGGGGGAGGGSSSFYGGAKSHRGEGSGGFGSAGGHRDARINADRFAGLPPGHEPDSEDEATAALISANPSAVWPMGIMRIERKEEKKALATSAELQAQEQAQGEEDIFVDGEVFSVSRSALGDNGAVWHAAPDVPVKAEPMDDSIPNMQPIDFDAHGKHVVSDTMETDPESRSSTTETQPEPKAQLKKKSGVDPEVEMIARNMKTLLSELGPSEEGSQQRDGRLYLFQFPPVLPPLKPIDPFVKPEPIDDDGVVAVDDPTNRPVDLTRSDADAEARPKKAPKDEMVTISDMAQQLNEGGFMGKLNVRRSGKVELDWGGRILELAPATDLNFLTKAVVVEQADEKPKAAEYGGEAFDMGKVMGRFVLAPVWADEEDWVVDPEDLEY